MAGSIGGALLADRVYARTEAARFWVASVGFLLAAPCLFALAHTNTLFSTKLAIVGVGLCAGLFLANQMAAAFDVVPGNMRASACGFMNLAGSMTAGFSALWEGEWKASLGIPKIMTLAALAFLGAALVLMYTANGPFRQDHRLASRASDSWKGFIAANN